MLSNQYYEIHNYKKPSFPFFCHLDTVTEAHHVPLHWHENTELLCCCKGRGILSAGGVRTEFQAGEMAIINSNELHSIHAITPVCQYYCIIISKKLCEENSIFPAQLHFPPVVKDESICREVDEVFQTLEEESMYALPEAKFRILLLYTKLAKRYAQKVGEEWNGIGSRKEELARKLVEYVDQHCSAPLSVRSACQSLGFSESYVCHTFREITGQTLTEYINCRRCAQAQQMLKSGVCNVSEAALQCGFTNLSYFSKIYRAVIGHLPKEDVCLQGQSV